jgi:hypothetical protein
MPIKRGLAKWAMCKLLKRKMNAGWGDEFQNGKSGGHTVFHETE